MTPYAHACLFPYGIPLVKKMLRLYLKSLLHVTPKIYYSTGNFCNAGDTVTALTPVSGYNVTPAPCTIATSNQ